MSFSSKFYGHVFISLKVISVLQKKRNKRDEKEVNKIEKQGYDTAFEGLCIFVYQQRILSIIFHLVFFPKIIFISLLFKNGF